MTRLECLWWITWKGFPLPYDGEYSIPTLHRAWRSSECVLKTASDPARTTLRLIDCYILVATTKIHGIQWVAARSISGGACTLNSSKYQRRRCTPPPRENWDGRFLVSCGRPYTPGAATLTAPEHRRSEAGLLPGSSELGCLRVPPLLAGLALKPLREER